MNGKRILGGLVLAGIGVAIALGSEAAARANGGGVAILPWGLILIGAVNVLWGVFESPSSAYADWNSPVYRNRKDR
jgi:hypothetical protein